MAEIMITTKRRLTAAVKPAFYSLPLKLRQLFDLGDCRTRLESYISPLLTSDCFFVKVGAFDGVTGDPIADIMHRYGWSGIMVEPVPYIFSKLQANYADREGVALENSAIASENGTRDFYYLKEADDPTGLPAWYNQVGSFSLEHLLKLKPQILGLEDLLVKESISCLTFEKLLEKYQCHQVDMIHVDTEGYDYEVIKMIDFDVIRPKAILYEHIHLHDGLKEESVRYLKEKGYETVELDNDILAFCF